MTLAGKGRWAVLAAALALQLSAALSLLFYSSRVKAYATRHGRIVCLACRASDPFSPFKGRYVKLTLAESQVQGGNLDSVRVEDLAGGTSKKIYCRMEEAEDGLWKVAGLRRDFPREEEAIYIEGSCSFWGSRGEGPEGLYARIDYDFDEYYLQENFAQYADRISWSEFHALEPVLCVYVARNGRCIQKGLTVKVGDERIAFEDYCKRELLVWQEEK